MKKHRGIRITLDRETLRRLTSQEAQAAGGRLIFVPTAGGNTCAASCSPLYCSPAPLSFDWCPAPAPTLTF